MSFVISFRKIILVYVEDSQKDDKYQSYKPYTKPLSIRQDIFILLIQPELILACDNCERILNSSVSILLVKSSQDRRDLCLTCMLQMRLNREWKYFVRPNFNVTTTESSWNICSELKMIKGLQKYGYGNWINVKNYLDYHGSNFTQEQIQKHYNQFYHTTDQKPIFNEFLFEVDPPNPLTLSFIEVPDPEQKKKEITDTAGYNPKREEHMFDYDPGAQSLISNLEFLPSDSAEETELKYKLLEEYNKKMEQRQKRYQFVVQHKLLSSEFKHKLFMELKVKKAVRRTMNCFERFAEFEEYQQMVKYMTLYEQMNGTIKQLMRHRRTFNNPTFYNLYQSMEKIQEERKQKNIKGAPELKIQHFSRLLGKRTVGTQVRLTCEQGKKRLKKNEFETKGMKITDISSQS